MSVTAMDYAQRRLAPPAEKVQWLTADVLTWQPQQTYQAWHDRAVFHFLTTARQQRDYAGTLRAATAPGAVAVFGCFAPDGPQQCSGVPVTRYSPAQLAHELGDDWRLISHDREDHIIPAGLIQPFTWVVLRKHA